MIHYPTIAATTFLIAATLLLWAIRQTRKTLNNYDIPKPNGSCDAVNQQFDIGSDRTRRAHTVADFTYQQPTLSSISHH